MKVIYAGVEVSRMEGKKKLSDHTESLIADKPSLTSLSPYFAASPSISYFAMGIHTLCYLINCNFDYSARVVPVVSHRRHCAVVHWCV